MSEDSRTSAHPAEQGNYAAAVDVAARETQSAPQTDREKRSGLGTNGRWNNG